MVAIRRLVLRAVQYASIQITRQNSFVVSLQAGLRETRYRLLLRDIALDRHWELL